MILWKSGSTAPAGTTEHLSFRGVESLSMARLDL